MTKFSNSTELKRKVELLKHLHVDMEVHEDSDLLLIKASGISSNENVGVPKLILTERSKNNLTNGILEFNFIIQGSTDGPKKTLEWDIAVVYRMDILPKGIKAVKVNAVQNADIALLMN